MYMYIHFINRMKDNIHFLCCLPVSRFALNTAGSCAIACLPACRRLAAMRATCRAMFSLPCLPAAGLRQVRAYARLGAAMFSLRCEHTPRFFRYFAQLRRKFKELRAQIQTAR